MRTLLSVLRDEARCRAGRMAPRCYSIICRGGCSLTYLGCSPTYLGCSPTHHRAGAALLPDLNPESLRTGLLLFHIFGVLWLAQLVQATNPNPDLALHSNLKPNPSPGPDPSPNPTPSPKPNSVQAIGYAAMSGAVSHWFFFRDQPSEHQRLPVAGSLWRAVRLPPGAASPATL